MEQGISIQEIGNGWAVLLPRNQRAIMPGIRSSPRDTLEDYNSISIPITKDDSIFMFEDLKDALDFIKEKLESRLQKSK